MALSESKRERERERTVIQRKIKRIMTKMGKQKEYERPEGRLDSPHTRY
jgi:hypothetical protein